jgi:hypothetical protein
MVGGAHQSKRSHLLPVSRVHQPSLQNQTTKRGRRAPINGFCSRGFFWPVKPETPAHCPLRETSKAWQGQSRAQILNGQPGEDRC